jgi:hypothetical protein
MTADAIFPVPIKPNFITFNIAVNDKIYGKKKAPIKGAF